MQQFKDIMFKQKENMIQNIIRGFHQHYFLDEEDLNQMQLIYKENLIRKNKSVPDLI